MDVPCEFGSVPNLARDTHLAIRSSSGVKNHHRGLTFGVFWSCHDYFVFPDCFGVLRACAFGEHSGRCTGFWKCAKSGKSPFRPSPHFSSNLFICFATSGNLCVCCGCVATSSINCRFSVKSSCSVNTNTQGLRNCKPTQQLNHNRQTKHLQLRSKPQVITTTDKPNAKNCKPTQKIVCNLHSPLVLWCVICGFWLIIFNGFCHCCVSIVGSSVVDCKTNHNRHPNQTTK